MLNFARVFLSVFCLSHYGNQKRQKSSRAPYGQADQGEIEIYHAVN